MFGPIASDTTVLRALSGIGTNRPAAIARVRAAARVHMWAQLPNGRPPESTFAADAIVQVPKPTGPDCW